MTDRYWLPPRTGPRARRAPRWRRVLVGIAVALSMLVVMASVVGFVAYRHLDGNISSEDIAAKLGLRPDKVRTQTKEQPLNILMLGSDSREGNGDAKYGAGVSGARSDTTILMHLSADREHATLVSIPRDSYVRLPACVRTDGTMSTPTTDRFNAAYSVGGTACTIKAVEKLTGVYIDHFVVVDFSGFKRMVDAVDGVQVCLPEAVKDSKSKLDLPAGRQTVKGEQALAYVRTRYGLGDGGDLSRIDRQQAFLGALVNKVKSTKLLLNLPRLYGFLDAATKSVTTDPDISGLNDLRKLAQSLQRVDPKNVAFVTVPNHPYQPNPNVVEWNQPEARELFGSLKADTPLPGSTGAARMHKKHEKPLRTPPSSIRVRVLNGSGDAGAAGRAAAELRRRGFVVTSVGNADRDDYGKTFVRYDPAYDESARTLGRAVKGSFTQPTPNLGGELQVVVGAEYDGTRAVRIGSTTPTPSATPTYHVRTADADICS